MQGHDHPQDPRGEAAQGDALSRNNSLRKMTVYEGLNVWASQPVPERQFARSDGKSTWAQKLLPLGKGWQSLLGRGHQHDIVSEGKGDSQPRPPHVSEEGAHGNRKGKRGERITLRDALLGAQGSTSAVLSRGHGNGGAREPGKVTAPQILTHTQKIAAF